MPGLYSESLVKQTVEVPALGEFTFWLGRQNKKRSEMKYSVFEKSKVGQVLLYMEWAEPLSCSQI